MGGGNRSILVVDDHDDLRDAVRFLLEGEDYEVAVATNGREALDYLRRTSPSPALILFDLMMPVVNGWQFREAQLSDPALAPIPAIVMTASRNVESQPLSASEVLLKPISADALFDAIRRYVP